MNISQEKQPPCNQRVTGGRKGREENIIEGEIVRRIGIHCDKIKQKKRMIIFERKNEEKLIEIEVVS